MRTGPAQLRTDPDPARCLLWHVLDHRQWPAEYSHAMDGAPGVERGQSAPSAASPPLRWVEGPLLKVFRFQPVFCFGEGIPILEDRSN